MPVIVIANPKGGVGKSTLSTNLAGYFANQGHAVLLGDIDRQQSSRFWLSVRPEQAKTIATWDISEDNIAKPPPGISHVILDTPAGLDGPALQQVLNMADKVIVPLQASIFDIAAAQAFLERMEQEVASRPNEIAVGIVGMRVDARTKSAEQLRRFVQARKLPVLSYLRNTQNYVQLAAHGLTLWDIAPARVAQDLAQWQSILQWVNAPLGKV
jgi:chromosome partitioning protein